MRNDPRRSAADRLDERLHGIDVLLDTVRRVLALPVHEYVIRVMVGENALSVSIIPSDEIQIVHPLEVFGHLIFLHDVPPFLYSKFTSRPAPDTLPAPA